MLVEPIISLFQLMYRELYELIDLPVIADDTVIADNQSHIIYIANPVAGNSTSAGAGGLVPIIIPGFQWDYLWWIHRLQVSVLTDTTDYNPVESFPIFLNEFLIDAYEKYLKKFN